MLLELNGHDGTANLGRLRFDSRTHRTVKIGSLATAQVTRPGLARIHAVITLTSSEASFVAMAAGTSVNGLAVHRTRLHDGDRLRVGSLELGVRMGERRASLEALPLHGGPALAPGPPASLPAPRGLPNDPGLFGATPPIECVARGDQAGIPRFDGGALVAPPISRITRGQLSAAAVESRPHPGMPPESPITPEHHALEMRVYWGQILLDMRHEVAPRQISIGEHKQADVFLSSEGLPADSFPLVRTIEDQCVLSFCRGMEGEVEIDGRVCSLPDLAGQCGHDSSLPGTYNCVLPLSGRALLHWAGMTFALRFVAPSRRVQSAALANVDLPYVNSLVVSGFFHLLLMVTLAVYPYELQALDEPSPKEDLVFWITRPDVQVALHRPLPAKAPPKPRADFRDNAGRRSRPRAVDLTRPYRPTRRPELVMERFAEMFSGRASRSLVGGELGSLTESVGNMIHSVGRGPAVPELGSMRLTPSGSAGRSGSSRTIDGIETGMPGGPPTGGELGRKKERPVESELRLPRLQEPLPRSVIHRVVEDHRQQIRYCYEKELHRNNDLEGRIVVSWLITAAGRVDRVRILSSSMKNPAVEGCMQQQLRTWRFPPPAGGGSVTVNYPFVFHAS